MESFKLIIYNMHYLTKLGVKLINEARGDSLSKGRHLAAAYEVLKKADPKKHKLQRAAAKRSIRKTLRLLHHSRQRVGKHEEWDDPHPRAVDAASSSVRNATWDRRALRKYLRAGSTTRQSNPTGSHLRRAIWHVANHSSDPDELG